MPETVSMEVTLDNEAHERFATLSGDFNPMHMDAVAARRTQAGARVVHGVHSLLWLLDVIASQHHPLPPPGAIKARFRKIVYVGDRAFGEVVSVTPAALRARMLIEGTEVLSLILTFDSPGDMQNTAALAGVERAMPLRPSVPIDLPFEQLAGRDGCLAFARPPAEWQPVFPHASRYLGVERVAALASCSCLVGMVVPGLHSMFAGLELAIVAPEDAADRLRFAVTEADPRFRLVRTVVRGGGLSGRLETSSPPPPVAQPTTSTMAKIVGREEFQGATALIVGGSRGLGEVTAKLIAAGGGRVIITYLAGRTDAQAVAADINGWGGHCEIMPYDARQSAAVQIERLPVAPSHVYYFATPTIAQRRTGVFSPQRLREFNEYYLTGFV
jgi:hypothetical protein